MALFESYERRIDKINSVLNSYGIASLEEAEKITKDAGLESALRTPAGPTSPARPSPSRRTAAEPPTQPQPSARDFRPSVSPVP